MSHQRSSRFLAIAAAFALAGCGRAGLELTPDETDLSGVKGGLTYAQFDQDRDDLTTRSFEGYGCLESCDGHEAGFSWAEDNGVESPAECDGNSWSFQEGCVAYAKTAQPEREPSPDLGLF
jgi:predicted small lipoprotein YifL